MRWRPAARAVVVAFVATSTSSLLLNARLRGIYALADTNTLARQLATTDQLTGLLNRHGLMERSPGLASAADRLGTGDDKKRWSGALSVGFAEGTLTIESMDDIIGRADDDMYRRREVR